MSGRSRSRSVISWSVRGSRCSGSPTGTYDGSKATGKLAEDLAASASLSAVRARFSRENGSSGPSVPTGRRHRNRPACRRWGRRWPIESTVTVWLPLITVVVMVRSIGARSALQWPAGWARSPRAALSLGRKYSSPCSSEVGWPRNGWRSSVSSLPWSIHRSRSRAGSARRFTWVRASAAPLMPPAEEPVITSTRAWHPVSRLSTE